MNEPFLPPRGLRNPRLQTVFSSRIRKQLLARRLGDFSKASTTKIVDLADVKLQVLTNQHATGPWSYRAAAGALRDAREATWALDYDAHALRHTKASALASEGYDDETIAAITGHTSLSMVKQYTAKVRQVARAQKTREQNISKT